jgi:serum/glucocorticoid-regulated kinase 2
LTDFGIARKCSPNNCKDNSGTPGYMAPEVLEKRNHGYAVDYYALGIIMYELAVGKRPYSSRARDEILAHLLSSPPTLSPSDLPDPSLFSPDFLSLVNGLMKIDPTERLGSYGIDEIKNHKFFNGFEWKKVEEKSGRYPPFCPKVLIAMTLAAQGVL